VKLFKKPENNNNKIYNLFKLVGLVPFSFNVNSKNGCTAKAKLNNKLHLGFLIGLYLTALTFLNCEAQIFGNYAERTFLTFSWHIIIYYSICTKIISIFFIHWRRRSLVDFLEIIEDFDRKVFLSLLLFNNNYF
jgi:hypothetical protein